MYFLRHRTLTPLAVANVFSRRRTSARLAPDSSTSRKDRKQISSMQSLPSDQSLSPSMLVTNLFRYFKKKNIFYKFCVQKASQVSFISNLHSLTEENRSQLNKRRFRIKLDKQITSSCLMCDILLAINVAKLGNGLDVKFHIVETLHYNYFGLVIT